MLPEILRVPVHPETGHLLLRDPHRTDGRLLKLLLDVKAEHVEGGGVTIEDGQGQAFAFPILSDHLLDHSREISAVAYPADTGEGRCLFLEGRGKSRIIQMDIKIIVHFGSERAVNHVGHLQPHHDGQRQKDDGEHVLQNDEHLAEHVLILCPELSFNNGNRWKSGAYPSWKASLNERDENYEYGIYNQPARGIPDPHLHAPADDPVEPRCQRLGKNDSEHEADGREQDRLKDPVPEQALF